MYSNRLSNSIWGLDLCVDFLPTLLVFLKYKLYSFFKPNLFKKLGEE